MQGLAELPCYLKIVTFHGALVLNVPSPHFLVLSVENVDVEGRMIARVADEYVPAGFLDTHRFYYQT